MYRERLTKSELGFVVVCSVVLVSCIVLMLTGYSTGDSGYVRPQEPKQNIIRLSAHDIDAITDSMISQSVKISSTPEYTVYRYIGDGIDCVFWRESK